MYKNRSQGLVLSLPAVSPSNLSKGFTLIELLVVIAIIGILSAVVLASLTTARNKGNDAAVQADLSTIQTEAEIFYGGDGGNSYGTVSTDNTCAVAGSLFAADGVIKRAIEAADSANGTGTGGTVTCNNSTTAYAVQAGLLNGIGGKMYWCVDSQGGAKAVTDAMAAGATACL